MFSKIVTLGALLALTLSIGVSAKPAGTASCCVTKTRCCDKVKYCCDQPEKAECCKTGTSCCDMKECCGTTKSAKAKAAKGHAHAGKAAAASCCAKKAK